MSKLYVPVSWNWSKPALVNIEEMLDNLKKKTKRIRMTNSALTEIRRIPS